MTRQEFIAWEQVSRDTIDVKRCYVDIAGDLVAGILLSQIVYWHLPDKDGNDKLKVVKDGEKWLAKGREEWWEECRITPKQFDRACTLLESLGLIATDLKRFNGSPVKHVRICWEAFLRDLIMQAMKVKGAKEAEGKMDMPQSVKSKCPKRQERVRPLVQLDIDLKANFLTETPLSENTQRIETETPPPPPSMGEPPPAAAARAQDFLSSPPLSQEPKGQEPKGPEQKEPEQKEPEQKETEQKEPEPVAAPWADLPGERQQPFLEAALAEMRGNMRETPWDAGHSVIRTRARNLYHLAVKRGERP